MLSEEMILVVVFATLAIAKEPEKKCRALQLLQHNCKDHCFPLHNFCIHSSCYESFIYFIIFVILTVLCNMYFGVV